VAERRFDPKEVKRILRRAEELRSPSASAAANSPTLRQLQEAASELGLSSELVARAAAELDDETDAGGFWAKFWGGPVAVQRSAMANGALPADSRPAILEKIRQSTGRLGEGSSLDRAFEFHSGNAETGETFHVMIAPDGDRSRVTVRASFQHVLASYLCVMFPFVPLMLFLKRIEHGTIPAAQAQIGVLGLCIACVLCFMTARGMVVRRVRRGRRQVDQLVQDLTSEIERRSVEEPRIALLPEHALSERLEINPGRA
jgi:hypothetical protein